jgi:hypothetical protein
MRVDPLGAPSLGDAHGTNASSRPVDEKSVLTISALQLVFAGAGIIMMGVGAVHAEFLYIESKIKADNDRNHERFKADNDRNHERFKADNERNHERFKADNERFKADNERNHERFKDELRLQAQATMNPPRAHLMFADRRPIGEILGDPDYAPLAKTRRWWGG